MFHSKHIRKNPFSLRPENGGVSQNMYYMEVEKKKKKMAFVRSNERIEYSINSIVYSGDGYQ